MLLQRRTACLPASQHSEIIFGFAQLQRNKAGFLLCFQRSEGKQPNGVLLGGILTPEAWPLCPSCSRLVPPPPNPRAPESLNPWMLLRAHLSSTQMPGGEGRVPTLTPPPAVTPPHSTGLGPGPAGSCGKQVVRGTQARRWPHARPFVLTCGSPHPRLFHNSAPCGEQGCGVPVSPCTSGHRAHLHLPELGGWAGLKAFHLCYRRGGGETCNDESPHLCRCQITVPSAGD